ncbi:unnamed protein product [Durusdinium trenchii]
MDTEADHLQIMALSSFLAVPVTVVYLDRSEGATAEHPFVWRPSRRGYEGLASQAYSEAGYPEGALRGNFAELEPYVSIEQRGLRQPTEEQIRQMESWKVAEMIRYQLELKPQYLSAFADYKNDYPGRRDLNYSDRCIVSHLYETHFEKSKEGDYPQKGELEDMDKDWFKTFVMGRNIHKVRDYFGERIALYFLFMSHFIKWMIIPTIFGTFLCVVDLFYQTPNNVTVVFICIGVGMFSTTFIHFWRRKTNLYALKWGTFSMKKKPETTRPEFYGVSRVNPVTSRVDRYYPWSERIWKVLFSYSVILVSLISLFFAVGILMVLRHTFHKHGGRITFQVINALVVELLNTLFTSLATWLTELRCFWPCVVAMRTGKKRSHRDARSLNDLGSQLAIFMIMRLTLQNMIELGGPYAVMMYRRMTEESAFNFDATLFTNPMTIMPDLSSPEKQSKKEDYDVYQDMDEVLILYGYTVLFVVACPWIPLIALISLVLECFLDQKKLVLLYRRPFPDPAANNEPWDTAFDVFGMLAMATNTAVVVFASNVFQSWSHFHKILLFMVVEHAMIGFRILISTLFPAIPWEVRLLAMQQQVVVHRHLNLGGEEDDHETRASAMMATAQPPPIVHDQDDEEDCYMPFFLPPFDINSFGCMMNQFNRRAPAMPAIPLILASIGSGFLFATSFWLSLLLHFIDLKLALAAPRPKLRPLRNGLTHFGQSHLPWTMSVGLNDTGQLT